MVKIESLGTVSGVNMFLTETLPHVEIEWEKFVSPPKVSVPATKGMLTTVAFASYVSSKSSVSSGFH